MTMHPLRGRAAGRVAVAVLLTALVAALVAACSVTTAGHGSVHRALKPSALKPSPSASSNDVGAPPLDNSSYRAAHAGRLPAAGRPLVGDVRLPVGRPVRADADGNGTPSGSPVMWVSDAVQKDAGETVLRLEFVFGQTGLWPVVLQSLETHPDDGRPWRHGEFAPSQVTAPDRIDIRRTVTQWWKQNLDESARQFGVDRVLGTSPPPLGRPNQVTSYPVDGLLRGMPGRIGLVSVTRPADVPARIGWLGATNYFDGGYVSAMLRSWEDRYGAVLIRIGFDYLEVAVRRPPFTESATRPVVAEQFAFCPDQILQGDFDTVGDYVHSLVGQDAWYCWWD